MKKVNLVIFDMDGLMFDTETVSRDAWRLAGEKLNLPVDDELFSEFLGTNANYIRNLIIKKYGETSPFEALMSERNILVAFLLNLAAFMYKAYDSISTAKTCNFAHFFHDSLSSL